MRIFEHRRKIETERTTTPRFPTTQLVGVAKDHGVIMVGGDVDVHRTVHEKPRTKNILVTYLEKMPTLQKPSKPSASSAKAPKKIASKRRESAEESDQNTQESSSGHEESRSESEEEQDLHGLTTDDDDSSDEDDNIDANPVDVDKLPTIAKDDAVVRAKLEKAKRQAVGPSVLRLQSPIDYG